MSLSKSRTLRCPPIFTGRSYWATKSSSSTRMPLSPLRSPFQVPSTSGAIDVVMAMPVTTMFGKPPFAVDGLAIIYIPPWTCT
ncbi:Uncharacterised protein [Mycobacteroides abscessus subsp. abscessus]|nr:Uncharacterised protein [Mycobacteroides abscessus subsp. abscessus]SIM98928.1 Uncharacterised protein [Mycobacteroides abscessus subsp. abscessus]SKS51418.1 Uncharacterised protein [Mycobacteroides abscessus subsp. abscessus]